MYIPNKFKEERRDVLVEFIRQNSFGILVTSNQNNIDTTHLPFMIDENEGENGNLIAHFAKANSHWKRIEDSTNALVIFHGPHSYISPEWYSSGELIPTWNYAAVHVRGKITITHDINNLRTMAFDLVKMHETSESSNWQVEKHMDVVEKLLPGIVGFTLEIESIEGKFKFNQNRSKEDQQGVVCHLEKSDCPIEQSVAEIMKKNLD